MKKFLKPLAVLACTVALVAGTVAATLAFLTDKTNSITNTFVAGDISITLTETAVEEFKMVPGTDIAKDPKVTVEAGSEACWLFVKLDKSANFGTYLTYTIADGWTPLAGVNDVYYRQVAAVEKDADEEPSFSVLAGDKVTALDATKEQYNSIAANKPTLSVTAYAIQYAGFAPENGKTVTDAWNAILASSQS